ncbi:MAG: GNAT family N-acetyltransferase [Coleofasciculaceae cyanobacterium SM2_1_6]|nr:GNAT family N-acetyltransferase [Coleofasciculaceae cyanobacterium SM2_1_6]
MKNFYQEFLIRDWQPVDRSKAAAVIQQVLMEYGLQWEPEEADQDVVKVEKYYHQTGGEFWVVVQGTEIVGTAAYYPTARGEKAVEIRKMYLLSSVRGRGLGSYLLQELEKAITAAGWQQIWLETATVLEGAVHLYERRGYLPTTGVETTRCDRIYVKSLLP